MKRLVSLAIVWFALQIAAFAQSKAVGVAIDPVEAEYDSAKTLTAEARAEYESKMAELTNHVASGRVLQSRASLLQRLFYLNVLEAEGKEAVAYLKLVSAASVKMQAERKTVLQSIAETNSAIQRLETQKKTLTRDLKWVRGPALLTVMEYERITGEKLMNAGDDSAIVRDLQYVSDEVDRAIIEAHEMRSQMQRRLESIDQSSPALEARKALGQQRQEVVRTKAIMVRAGASSDTQLPPLPEFKPLPPIFGIGVSSPGADRVLDEEQLRSRIGKEKLYGPARSLLEITHQSRAPVSRHIHRLFLRMGMEPLGRQRNNGAYACGPDSVMGNYRHVRQPDSEPEGGCLQRRHQRVSAAAFARTGIQFDRLNVVYGHDALP